MKTALQIIFTLAGLAILQQGHATHVKAVSMYYDCLSGDSIQMNVVQYQDCGGILPSPGQIRFIGAGGAPGCSSPVLLKGPDILLTVDVTPVCASVVTNCQTGNGAPGYAERIFSTRWSFAGATCTQYEASWDLCCRQLTTSHSGPTADILINGTTIDLATTPCNSSPRFLNPPTMWLCSGVSAVFENQTYDPDGDSLAYRMIDCQGNPSSPVNFNPTYSTSAPLGPGWPVSLDPVSGNITFTASPGGIEAGYVCLEVVEYRNGVEIGATTMDFKVDVQACGAGNNDVPVIDSLYTISGGNIVGNYEIEVYDGDTLTFGLLATDINAGDSLTTTLDTASRLANVLLGTTGTNPQNIKVIWPSLGLGTYSIRLNTHDQHCPTPGFAWRTIIIHVVPAPISLAAFFPGDANLDGLVDQTDILALGLGYNTNGPSLITPPFDTSWMAFTRLPWASSFAFGGNFAYADCDANGSIDAADKAIVDKHFGLNHMQGNYSPVFITGNTVPMSVVVDADTFAGGDSIEAHIELGSMTQPANGVYGVSFVLTYDTAMVDSFRLSTSFANSWMGTQNVLTFEKQLLSQGKVAIAITRTDQQPVSGFGALADVIIIVDDVAGKREEYLQVNLTLSDVMLITADGRQFDDVPVSNEEFIVTRSITSILPQLQVSSLTIFPQPAGQGPLHILLDETMTGPLNIEVYDLQGREVYSNSFDAQTGKITLNGSTNWPRGIYKVHMYNDRQRWSGKMIR